MSIVSLNRTLRFEGREPNIHATCFERKPEGLLFHTSDISLAVLIDPYFVVIQWSTGPTFLESFVDVSRGGEVVVRLIVFSTVRPDEGQLIVQ